MEVSIANGYPFARLGAHPLFLSWSNSSLGTNNSAYPQSKQTTIFWIKLTGARFSFSIGRNATENSPEKFCCFSEVQLLQAISPPNKVNQYANFQLSIPVSQRGTFLWDFEALIELSSRRNVGLDLFMIESFGIGRAKSLSLLTVFVSPFTGQV